MSSDDQQSRIDQQVSDQRLAFDAMTTGWAGLDHDLRQDMVDVLQTYDFGIAFDILLTSPTLDPLIADRLRKRSAALTQS